MLVSAKKFPMFEPNQQTILAEAWVPAGSRIFIEERKTRNSSPLLSYQWNPTILTPPSGSSEILPEGGIKMVGLERTSADALDFRFLGSPQARKKNGVFKGKIVILQYENPVLSRLRSLRRAKNTIAPCKLAPQAKKWDFAL